MAKMLKSRKAVLSTMAMLILVTVLGGVIAVQYLSIRIPNSATVQGAGLGIYWDMNFSNHTTSITWGTIAPSTNYTRTLYIRNEQNANVTLELSTENWNPASAANYITVS